MPLADPPSRIPLPLGLAFGLALAAGAPPLAAQTAATRSLQVSATVDASCRIVSPGGPISMSFGTVDATATGTVSATPTFRLQCSRGESPVISLDSGQQPRGALQKRMRAGTTENYLEYQIRVPSNVGFADSGTCAPSNREWSFAQRLSLGPVFAAAGGSLDVRLCGYVNTPQAAAAPSALPFTDIVVMTVTF